MNVNLLALALDVTFATANGIVDALQGVGMVEEITGGRRNRVFRYTPYLRLFSEPEIDTADAPQQITHGRT